MEHSARVVTPFAVIGVRTANAYLTSVEYLAPSTPALPPREPLAREVCRQIERYLRDPRFRFDLPIVLEGTPFRRRVWHEIARIPSGSTRTYGELAKRLGSAARAVGGACGDNPVPLVIPCHRVLAAGGLGGFMHAASGLPLDIKRWLLAHEGA